MGSRGAAPGCDILPLRGDRTSGLSFLHDPLAFPAWGPSSAEWRTAWYDPEKDENGLPKKVARLLDRWERDIGMRVNLETGEIERLPAPGPAYADDPEIAPRCK